MVQIKELEKSDYRKEFISDFLKKYECLLPDPYSLHVDIDAYAGKLNEYGVTFVACIDKDVVGMVCGYINDKESKNAYLQIIIVSEKSQNTGCGSLLLNSFIDKAKAEFETGRVFLNVDKCNSHAYNVYKHIGFVESEKIHPNPSKQIMQYNF